MNLRSLLLLPVAAIVQWIFVAPASAQLVAYESFAGMPVGSGLAGSGATATGWSDSGWANGSDPRYQTVDPFPDFFYQIAAGASLDGSNRAVQLTTNPEPVPPDLVASRAFPEQSATIYFSFLVRPIAIGADTDTLYLNLSNGSSSFARVALQPEVRRQYWNLRLLGGSGIWIDPQGINPSTTYLIAGKISGFSQSQTRVETWINPPADYPGDGSQYITIPNFPAPQVFSSVGFGISSSDTGGPTSTVLFDELRIGHTWADVVLPGPVAPRLGNLSTRVKVETGDNVLIGGFIVTGTEPKKVLVRSIGPSLATSAALNNPTLELRDGLGGLIAANDDWRSSQQAEIIETTLQPWNPLESAIIATLPGNNSAYTAIVRGVNNATGLATVEVYDLNRSVDSKLANISTRGLVQAGENVLIGGAIVLGQESQTVLVRALGPSLNLSGKMPDPTLELWDGQGALIRSNDNWRSDQEAAIIATGIPPGNDLESAIVETLPSAGAPFTAVVRGAGGTTGLSVVEIYALN